jgi:hypothetical protein
MPDHKSVTMTELYDNIVGRMPEKSVRYLKGVIGA